MYRNPSIEQKVHAEKQKSLLILVQNKTPEARLATSHSTIYNLEMKSNIT